MEFTSHRQSCSQAVQKITSRPAEQSVLRVGCHESRATYTPRTAMLPTLRTVRVVEYNMRRSSAIRGTPFFLSTPFRRKHNAKT
jgi:hypothetical protein